MKRKISIFLILFMFSSLFAAEPLEVDLRFGKTLEEDEIVAIVRGNIIVEALDMFFKDNGYYPEKLDELIPKYISEIPKTDLVKIFFPTVKYEYCCWYQTSYDLKFKYNFDYEYVYSSSKKRWSFRYH